MSSRYGDNDVRFVDRDYNIGGGVTMERRDFQHGFVSENDSQNIGMPGKEDVMKSLKEIMSTDVACATTDKKISEVAKMMVDYDCGEIPIVNSLQDKTISGVITDRDIVCRTLGRGLNPMDLTVKECMTTDVFTADFDMTVEDCIAIMREHKIRRLPVVDENNKLCGMVSQADLAKSVNVDELIDFVQDVSRPSDEASVH